MKIVVLEHFTVAPPENRSADLETEGEALRDAVVADLLALPDTEVQVLHRLDRPIGNRSPRLRGVPVEGDHERIFRELVRSSGAALVIAPERDGVLETLSRIVEREGRILLGPAPPAVAIAADKLECATRLAAAGVSTPRAEAIPFDTAPDRLARRSAPFVVKPRDGCGCQGVSLVRRREQIGPALTRVRRATGLDHFLVQDHVTGVDASVSIIAGDRLLALGLNRQSVRRRGRWTYTGGEVPIRHRLERVAVEAAKSAVAVLTRACGETRGYLGVDLVLGRDRPWVIEINPRLTTSYIGLRRVIRRNLAGLIQDAAVGRPLPDRVKIEAHCRFSADGKTYGKKRSWSTSVGTSAASI